MKMHHFILYGFYVFYSFLFKYSITSWIAGFLFYSVGAIFCFSFKYCINFGYYWFLTPFVVKYLNETSYKNLNLKPYGTIFRSILGIFESIFMMILLYILFIPLYFIPLINFIALYLPLYYFFHKMLNYDVSSTILSKEEYEKIYSKSSSAFRVRTLLLYFISTIPFVTLFVSIFILFFITCLFYRARETSKNRK